MRDLIDLFFSLTFLQYSRISSLSVMQLFLSVEETHRPCSPMCWARYTSPGSHKVATLDEERYGHWKYVLVSKRKTRLAQSTISSKCFASQKIIYFNYRMNKSLFFFTRKYYKESIRFFNILFIFTIIASHLLKTKCIYYFVYNYLQILITFLLKIS